MNKLNNIIKFSFPIFALFLQIFIFIATNALPPKAENKKDVENKFEKESCIIKLGNDRVYVRNGKVDYSYNGVGECDGISYYFSNGKVVKIYGAIDTSKPMIALTYDDGPSELYTNRIVNELSRVGGRATFYVIGDNVNTYGYQVIYANNHGCDIGNHSSDYTSLITISQDEIIDNISKCNRSISDSIGTPARTVRPVGGHVNDMVINTIDYPLITWSVNTYDWRDHDADLIYSRVIGNVSDGDIVLMHDTFESTADASERIIPELVSEGYQLVTVEELAYYKGYDLKSHTIYSSFK